MTRSEAIGIIPIDLSRFSEYLYVYVLWSWNCSQWMYTY
jgi:hypothetical protein